MIKTEQALVVEVYQAAAAKGMRIQSGQKPGQPYHESLTEFPRYFWHLQTKVDVQKLEGCNNQIYYRFHAPNLTHKNLLVTRRFSAACGVPIRLSILFPSVCSNLILSSS
jgi:hypothetical protein